MTDKEKLTALVNQFASGNQQMFAQLIGVPRSNVATWMHRDSITANGREAILDAFPQVSREWLQGARGDDEMMDRLPDTIHFSRRDLIPFFENCRASCGVAEQFEHPEYASDFIRVPGTKAKAAIEAEGISMEPTIREGDICLIGDDLQLADINPRSIYLIVTATGQCMFKRIFNEGRTAPTVLALSENPAYTPQAQPIDKQDILHIYPLVYVMRKASGE